MGTNSDSTGSGATGNGDTTTVPGSYNVFKNFDTVPAKAVGVTPGEAVVGVLLKHSSEGAYNSTVFSKDPNTFSIFCLFGAHGFNGDKMEFNYVLYVPEDIYAKYKAANGKNPTSGNPFWWYMVTYYKLDVNTISTNWPAIIDTLCNQTKCPEAQTKDIGTWAN